MKYHLHEIESEVEEVKEDAPATVLELIDDNILKEWVDIPINSSKHCAYVH